MIKKNKKLPIAAGIAGVFIFIISILFTANYSHSFQNWYTTNEYFDWRTMAISHFGVSNLAIPFTIVVSLVCLLIIFFIIGVRREYGGKGLLKKGTSWIIAGFLALMFAFLFLLYQPNATFSIALHFFVATVYFVSIPVGMIMIGKYFIKEKKAILGYSSVVLGIVAFIFGPLICMGSSLVFGNKGVAIPEFLQIITEDLWILMMSIAMLRKGVKHD
jgi:hypothetical membrane protein